MQIHKCNARTIVTGGKEANRAPDVPRGVVFAAGNVCDDGLHHCAETSVCSVAAHPREVEGAEITRSNNRVR